MTAPMRSPGSDDAGLARQIVDTAIDLAEIAGWENVRLRTVAERLDVPLAEIRKHFRDLNAIADAWFARAQQAMLLPPSPGFAALSDRERIEAVLWRWFEQAGSHRQVSVQMLKAKMWPFHPHHWIPMIFDLSRSILWLRDAAGCDAPPPRRELEEIGLTWLFLAVLAVWAGDQSEGQERTRQFLHARLVNAHALMTILFGTQPGTRAAT